MCDIRRQTGLAARVDDKIERVSTLYHLSGEQLALRDARTLQPFHYNHAPFTFEIPHRLHWILPSRRSIAISNSGTSLYMLKIQFPK
jgi:hypothetical protein